MTTVKHCYILFTVITVQHRILQSACRVRRIIRKVPHMHIIINNTSMIPVYEQLMDHIKQEIIQGTLQEGEGLPSVRSFANDLKISALTVKKAYDKLEEEGFVVTVHGKGTYVAATDRQLAFEARRKAVEENFADAVSKARSVGLNDDEIREILEIILDE